MVRSVAHLAAWTPFIYALIRALRGGWIPVSDSAVIALRSWHPKADCSTIVPLVDEPVTSFQMTSVVTEQGAAEIYGNDQQEQARQLIDRAAHPSVRDELWEEAQELGLVRGA